MRSFPTHPDDTTCVGRHGIVGDPVASSIVARVLQERRNGETHNLQNQRMMEASLHTFSRPHTLELLYMDKLQLLGCVQFAQQVGVKQQQLVEQPFVARRLLLVVPRAACLQHHVPAKHWQARF